MGFKIGDCVIYEEEDINGEGLQGKIIAIGVNSVDMITTYLVILDSGVYVQFTSDNFKWGVVSKPALVA